MTGLPAVLSSSLSWYAALSFVGLLALPLSARMLRWLPDCGLSLARPVGLLAWGYVFWLLGSFGVLQNDIGGAVFALLILALLSGWALLQISPRALVEQLKRQRRLILSMEAVFFTAFVLWTLIRAAGPEASGTEKPMELAFINSILRSPGLPPADPWFSGYSISYYYFGYVLVALLARLTGLPGATAFNLGAASWFAMTALAAYGLLYNLLVLRPVRDFVRTKLAALLGPLFLLAVSNWGGILEVIHSAGWFWRDGQSRFWTWLNVQELVNPPTPPYTGEPERTGGYWWWRASRVLSDYGMDGGFREVIDEFPLFSYLLGDLHPHVLAMPFALLAAGLALNAYLHFRSKPSGMGQFISVQMLRSVDFWLLAFALGALSFLNTWDFPMYLVLFGAAVALAGIDRRGWHWGVAFDFIAPVTALGIAGALLYLPFTISFSSQAQGFLPSLIYFTRGAHLWVMFGPLLAPLFAWLLWSLVRGNHRSTRLGSGFLVAGGLLLGLFLLMLLISLSKFQVDPGLAGFWGAGSPVDVFAATFSNRLAAPGGWVTLLLLLACIAALLLRRPEESSREVPSPAHPSNRFVLLLLLVGAGLVTFPEFFYLHDGFGTRMNTIFKFYFQAWVLWAVAAGYASIIMMTSLSGIKRWLYTAGWVVLFLVALPYGWFWGSSRLAAIDPSRISLDGTALMPAERQAVEWLESAPYGVVVEAVGGSYSGYARIATHTGLPGVLGWPGHELQWRGGVVEIGSRQPDIERLYTTRDWEEAQQIIQRYNIRYIVLGSLERSTYRAQQDFFLRHLPVGYENEQVMVFLVPQSILEEGQAFAP